MGIGNAPLPVDSAVEANNPVPATGDDPTNHLGGRLTVLERTGNALISQQLTALTARVAAMEGTFIVATTVPFTVKLDGGSVAVAALKHVGSSYVVGTAGRYTRDTGSLDASVVKPLCLPTA